MLQALAEKADEAEWKLLIQQQAHERDLALQAGEPGIEWHEMRAYLDERLASATVATDSTARSKPSKH